MLLDSFLTAEHKRYCSEGSFVEHLQEFVHVFREPTALANQTKHEAVAQACLNRTQGAESATAAKTSKLQKPQHIQLESYQDPRSRHRFTRNGRAPAERRKSSDYGHENQTSRRVTVCTGTIQRNFSIRPSSRSWFAALCASEIPRTWTLKCEIWSNTSK